MAIKVLLCDSADWLGQLQYALMRSGADLQIEVVTDGFRAVEAAARAQPDIVVTEIALDGLGGSDLVRRLLVTVPETHVVCWTVLPSPVTAGEMLGAGASGYLLKEDGPDAVLRAIRSVLEGNVTLSHRVSLQLAERFVAESGQREHLESSLTQTSEQLAQLTSAKAEFLANISHELRTPITVAKGIAYVLKNRGIPQEEQEEFLAKLESSLEKLMMLVDEMLTIADLDRGTLALKISDVDLSPLLTHAVDEIHRLYPEVEIETQIPGGLHASADPVRIAEVTRQLLDNACRYSPADEAVEVRARSMSEGVVVSITDHGRGVERQLIAQAFNEPFSTSEDILTKERDGAGVGLHMARQLIRQHGGIIWADPLPAGGTRVSFCLPARSGDELTGPPRRAEEVPGEAGDEDRSDAPEARGFLALLPNAATSPNG
ncbi:MAG TPA: ATP-binding protein [Actinomycetota bacterium]|nr:ATP-binding protein [Actinomycetota bacterium]